MGEEDKGLDIEKLTKAIASELKKLNEADKSQTPAVPGNMEREVKTISWNCPECGATLKGGEKYCPSCGVELEWAE